MKKILLFVVLSLVAASAWSQDVDSLLKAIYVEDQAVRNDLIRVVSQQPQVADSVIIAHTRMQQVDARNQQIVFSLLDNQGWPAGLSREANRTIWIVLDHAGQADLKRYMPLVERQAESGTVLKSEYATMLDRMLMRDGLRQRYGTQTVSASSGGQTTAYVWPVEDAARLDELRVQVGLPPIDEYVKMVEQAYRAKVVWDSTLGIEDMPVKYPQKGSER